jgi:Fe-S cluster assembly protein SufD
MELPVQQFRTKAEQAYLDMFDSAGAGLPGARDSFVADLRAKAIAAYGRLGLPHRRIEAWKYTDLRSLLGEVHPLMRSTGLPIDAADVKKALGASIAAVPAFRLFIVEGELRADLSDVAALKSAGVAVVSLAEGIEKPSAWFKQTLGAVNPRPDDVVVALNTALMTGGVALRVGEGVTLDKPIHIIHLDGMGEPASIFTRSLVIAEPSSAVTLIESHASLGRLRGLQRNAVTELRIDAKSAVDHIKIEREGDDTVHLGTALVEIGTDARYNAFQFSTGAALVRNQTFARFAGEGSSLDISGALLMRGRQHCDTTLLVEHAVPRCTSRELFKAALDGEARGIFQGKIIVAPNAQKTDGKQMAQALLLSERAEFDSKPELEIFADDVACGHGSTSGQIDDDLLFYLEARGIPEDEARALLIQAFIGEALEKIEHENLREALIAASADWLDATPE